MGHYDDCREAAEALRQEEKEERSMKSLERFSTRTLLKLLLKAYGALDKLEGLDPPLRSSERKLLTDATKAIKSIFE